MSRSGRTTVGIARRHSDPPSASSRANHHEHERDERPKGTTARESAPGIESRTRRSYNHHVPLAVWSASSLDVLHSARHGHPEGEMSGSGGIRLLITVSTGDAEG
jgi:hypothetical protein